MEKTLEMIFIWMAVAISFYVFSYVLYEISTSIEEKSNRHLPAMVIYILLVLLTAAGIYFFTEERGIMESIGLFYVIAAIGWITNKKGIGKAGTLE